MSSLVRVLRCETCKRVEPCTLAELLRFTWRGWPRCCGEVMALVSAEDRRAAADTSLQMDALPTEPPTRPRPPKGG